MEQNIFNGGILQNYLAFTPANMLNILAALLRLICGNLMEFQKKY